MIELMQRLIDDGHAYAAGGDVYFDVRSFPEATARCPASASRHAGRRRHRRRRRASATPRDFALWKGAKPGEPTWDDPWGPGPARLAPGVLGHGHQVPRRDASTSTAAALDLIFPHHENEIAQSKAAGDGFARYWLHNAWVTIGGEKMSKSLGNSLLVPTRWASACARRAALLPRRPRTTAPCIEYSDEALAEAAVGVPAHRGLRHPRGRGDRTTSTRAAPLPQAFDDAMDDDLGVPQALAVVHEVVREGNAALAHGDKEQVARLSAETRHARRPRPRPALGAVARLAAATAACTTTVDALVAVALEQRQAARARKDYAAADAIRDQLSAAGVDGRGHPPGSPMGTGPLIPPVGWHHGWWG